MTRLVFAVTTTLGAVLLGCGVFWPVVAFGQEGALVADPNALAQQWWNFVTTGHYAAALGPGVMLAVWALRKYDLKIPKYGAQIDALFNQPLVAFALPTVLASFGGFGTAMAAGQPLKAAIEPTVKAAMSAIVTYIMLKKASEQLDSAVNPPPKPAIILPPPPGAKP